MIDPVPPRAGWQRAKLVLKAVEVRLRFVAILVVTGLVIGSWDTIANHWEKWRRRAPAPVAGLAPDAELYCPMHPQVVRRSLDAGGAVPRCPICGMPLAQRTRGGAAPLPPGVTGRVQLSPERIALAGIATEEVARRPLSRDVTTVGTVQYDEARLSRIVARTGGYIEKLLVNQTFARVEEGEPLAEIYSPELYASARELVAALRSGAAPELVESAKERLRLLGVAQGEVDEIARSQRASPRLVIRSPRSGHVIEKPVVEGAHVEAGATLFEVADLSEVWIEAAVFERDIPYVREGAAVEATLEAVPGRTFPGKVALVHPHVDPATRTEPVRFALENADHALRPGMFATVRIAAPLADFEPLKSQAGGAPPGEVLAVPERAVIDAGARRVVYVEREPGVFEGRAVELGPRAGGFYAVLRGLEAGERVAAAGAFLIDAETRLNPAAASTFSGAAGAPRAGPRRS
jgi:Cu(I)/Ag(I) efflux system membrane fusion protein